MVSWDQLPASVLGAEVDSVFQGFFPGWESASTDQRREIVQNHASPKGVCGLPRPFRDGDPLHNIAVEVLSRLSGLTASVVSDSVSRNGFCEGVPQGVLDAVYGLAQRHFGRGPHRLIVPDWDNELWSESKKTLRDVFEEDRDGLIHRPDGNCVHHLTPLNTWCVTEITLLSAHVLRAHKQALWMAFEKVFPEARWVSGLSSGSSQRFGSVAMHRCLHAPGALLRPVEVFETALQPFWLNAGVEHVQRAVSDLSSRVGPRCWRWSVENDPSTSENPWEEPLHLSRLCFVSWDDLDRVGIDTFEADLDRLFWDGKPDVIASDAQDILFEAMSFYRSRSFFMTPDQIPEIFENLVLSSVLDVLVRAPVFLKGVS